MLGDWCAGHIPYYTLPPPASAAALASAEDAAHESAQIVSGWSAEFDAERVFADERRVVLERLAPAPPRARAKGRARVDDIDQMMRRGGRAGRAGGVVSRGRGRRKGDTLLLFLAHLCVCVGRARGSGMVVRSRSRAV